jgi:hypothetical protein
MLAHREKPWLQYVKECNQFRFGIVSFLDFRDMLAYLTGKSETSTKIVAPVVVTEAAHPVATALPPTLGGLPPTVDSGMPAAAGSKRGRNEEDEDAQRNDGGGSLAGSQHSQDDNGDYVMDTMREESQPEVNRPLSEAEIKAKRRKEETIKRDEEQIVKIDNERSLRMGDIMDDEVRVAAIRAQERPTLSKEDLLRSSTRSFKHFLNLMFLRQNEGKNRKRGETAQQQEAKKQSARKEVAQKRGRDQKKGKAPVASSSSAKKAKAGAKTVPIVIVPASQTSNITLLNAVDLLVKGQWVSLQRKKDEQKGAPSPQPQVGKSYKSAIFTHSTHHEDGLEVVSEFEVVDSTRHFAPADWERVIAIFTNGKEWEFKDWKLGDPATMFHRVSGFYLAFKGEAVPANITNWKVTTLWLEKNARHSDSTAQRIFWEVVKREAAKEKAFQNVF